MAGEEKDASRKSSCLHKKHCIISLFLSRDYGQVEVSSKLLCMFFVTGISKLNVFNKIINKLAKCEFM